MRTFCAALIFVALNSYSLAGPLGATIKTTPDFARESLRGIVSPWFYKSVLISPIEAWVVVRGTLVNSRLVAPRVVRSELNGIYDPIALEVAKDFRMTGFRTIETQIPSTNVLLHFLVYEIADGKVGVSFAHVDSPGGTQMRYFGSAWLAVLKDGRWTPIESPDLPKERRGKPSYTLAVRPAAVPDTSTPLIRQR